MPGITDERITIAPFDASEVSVLNVSLQNKPIQFPVTGGLLYYLKLTPNGGNPSPADLTLNVREAPDVAVQRGDFAVNDDTPGFPLVLASSTGDYTALKFVNDVVAGEEGDTLESGIFLLNDANNEEGVLYGSDYVEIVRLTGSNIDGIRTHTPTQKFYVGRSANPPTYATVTDAGVISATVPMTGSAGTTIRGIAVNNAETILYHADTGVSAVVQRWDMPGAAALSDLAVAVGTDRVIDIFVLADDTILDGLLGEQFRVKWKSTGTYSGLTSLAITAVLKS